MEIIRGIRPKLGITPHVDTIQLLCKLLQANTYNYPYHFLSTNISNTQSMQILTLVRNAGIHIGSFAVIKFWVPFRGPVPARPSKKASWSKTGKAVKWLPLAWIGTPWLVQGEDKGTLAMYLWDKRLLPHPNINSPKTAATYNDPALSHNHNKFLPVPAELTVTRRIAWMPGEMNHSLKRSLELNGGMQSWNQPVS